MFLDHLDTFGKFLKFFFVQKPFFHQCWKKKGGGEAIHCFCRFLKNSSLWISLAKII